ncbi:MAG: RNA polymerase sigma factor [Myxococcales bacterium]|nr:RNA polymerase sigma factor [Myxococcales bacterium]
MSANDEQISREMSDGQLVDAAKRGELRAFCELVERSQGLARAVAYSASGELGSVEDLVQEAMVTAWTRLHDLSDPSAFRLWLAGIVRNTVRYWRRHQRRHAPRAQAGMDVLSQLESTAPSPLDEAQRQQDWQHTSNALQALPDKYREPLVLYYSLGESHAEVADALGLTEASARQRVHRARKKLASEVGGVANQGRRLAARTSAAAGILLVIQERKAWASLPVSTPAGMTAPASPSLSLSPGASLGPSAFLGLGALGGAAIVACIVGFVMLVGGESESIGSTGPRSALMSPPPPVELSTAHLGQPIGSEQEAPIEAPIDAMAGLLSIGRGNVGDSPRSRNSAYPKKSYERSELSQSAETETSRTAGRIKKHGPAILHPEDEKPLLVPDIDMRAVRRELWQ